MNNTLTHHGILGQKWGVRRYQNKDGTLTAAGKARLEKDTLKNSRKKRKDQISKEALNDPERWVREDIENKQRLTNTSASLVRQLQSMEKETRPKPVKQKMDLSNMTDQELRQRINRELSERQYNELFGNSSVEISKGREYVTKTLETAGDVLAIGSSVLGIALAIKELKK